MYAFSDLTVAAPLLFILTPVVFFGKNWEVWNMKLLGWLKSSSVLEIGRDISWIEIIRHVFRVLEFDRSGTKIDQDNTVIANSSFKPYGYLIVGSPILKQNVKLPIVHKDDFLLTASVFDDQKLSEEIQELELLVTYIPKHIRPDGLASIWHSLHFVITKPGTLENFYKNETDVTNPTPEKIFNNISWEGEIRVSVNLNPILD